MKCPICGKNIADEHYPDIEELNKCALFDHLGFHSMLDVIDALIERL